MRNKFSFYASYYEMIKDLTSKQKLDLLTAIIEYGLLGKEPKLTGALRACFLGIKPNIDNDNRRYDVNFANGLKGGNPNFKNKEKQPNNNRPPTEQQPSENRAPTELQPNNNRNATDRQPDARGQEREKEKDIEIEKDIDIDKEREKEKEKEIKPTFQSGQTISLSKAQDVFRKSFPNKKIDFLPDESLIDINKLALAIKDSDFLSSSNNIGLKWCCEHYAEIVRGDYKNYKKPHNQKLNEAYAEQPFTADELASLAEVLEENKKLEK